MFALQIQLESSEQVSKVSVLTELLFSDNPALYGADAAEVGISLADSLRVFIYNSWDGLEPERWEDLIKELRKCADSIEEQLEEQLK